MTKDNECYRVYDHRGNEIDINEVRGINVNCFACTKKILEKGAILFSPPKEQFSDNVDITQKFHLCKSCFDNVMNFILGKVNGIQLPPKLYLILNSLESNKMTTAMRQTLELIELMKVHPMTLQKE